jgi:hypothetical protein
MPRTQTACEDSGVTQVPVGFPFKLDDDELERAISEMLERDNWPGFENFGALLPELKLALVAAGLRELAQRDQARSDRRVLQGTYAILAVSVIALIVSVIAVLTA